jgi:hypothetical protein
MAARGLAVAGVAVTASASSAVTARMRGRMTGNLFPPAGALRANVENFTLTIRLASCAITPINVV